MPLDVAHAVRLADHAIGIDQVRAPLRPLRHRLFGNALRLVQLADGVIGVGEKAEREAVLLREPSVVLDRVEGRAEDLDAELFELWGSITEPLAFARSPVGERFGEPPERDPAAAQVGERDGTSVLVREREVRRGRSLREHARSLLGRHCTAISPKQRAPPPSRGEKHEGCHPYPKRQRFHHVGDQDRLVYRTIGADTEERRAE